MVSSLSAEAYISILGRNSRTGRGGVESKIWAKTVFVPLEKDDSERLKMKFWKETNSITTSPFVPPPLFETNSPPSSFPFWRNRAIASTSITQWLDDNRQKTTEGGWSDIWNTYTYSIDFCTQDNNQIVRCCINSEVEGRKKWSSCWEQKTGRNQQGEWEMRHPAVNEMEKCMHDLIHQTTTEWKGWIDEALSKQVKEQCCSQTSTC